MGGYKYFHLRPLQCADSWMTQMRRAQLLHYYDQVNHCYRYFYSDPKSGLCCAVCDVPLPRKACGLYPEILGNGVRAIPSNDTLGIQRAQLSHVTIAMPVSSVSTDAKCDPNLWRVFGAPDAWNAA